MVTKKYSTEIAGRKLEVEFSDLAMHASGSVLVRYGKTVIFAAATMSKEARTGIDYFPLSVNYEEKFYAAGQILGSRFMKREGKPSDEAVLTGRLIDRTLRPLFSNKLRNEVQIVIMPLSIDGENDPDVPSIIAASLALATSDIPWAGPVSPLRLGLNGKKVVFNPTNIEREESALDLVACAKEGKINMIEAGAKEVAEEDIMAALKEAMPEFEKIEKFQKEIIVKEGKEKLEIKLPDEPEGLAEAFNKHIKGRLEDYIYISEKAVRNTRLSELKKEWTDWTNENFGEDSLLFADDIYEKAINDIVHKNIIEHEKRPDTRKLNELRDLYAKAGALERVHGSGIFYRGETHILSVATLGAPGDVQLIEGMEIQTKKRFMHHYNFPPFSTGETGRMGSPGRREIGHGALAERALEAVIPPKEIFPYTIRLVSEAMSSNGSTSMGSVCASTLALMDAGVPIKEPVAGIAMGLMMGSDSGGENKYKVLTDIQGPEDHHGDMDFKAAGTKNGISAIQMDVKVEGVTLEILSETLRNAKEARIKIIEVLLKEIAKPRENVSPNAPKIITISINPDKIRDVVGPGGKTINKIIDETGAEIDIEQTGEIFITGRNQESAEKAAEAIRSITREYEVGEEFMGKVSRIFEFGAMVEIGPKQDGLVHVSELASYRVNKVRDVVNIGDEVPVKIISIDELGRINLSIKQSSQYSEKQNKK
ncbi:MAG: polyribonucleotide nucleotidyltransferase [Patescibacteria group bacterium]